MTTALVTGGAKRLGKAMCLALAEQGYNVAIHYHQSDFDAKETAKACQAYGVRADIVKADLLNADELQSFIPKVSNLFSQPISVLVNNASIFEYDRLETTSMNNWEQHINSNLRAPYFLSQAFAKQAPKATLDAQGEHISSSCIVNMLDQRIRKLTPEFSSYTISKMGLWAFTKTAAQGLAPDIRVNAIAPGPTLKGAKQTDAHFDAQREATILRRGSNVTDIVSALNFILSSPSLTGQVLCMDGGQHLGWNSPDIIG